MKIALTLWTVKSPQSDLADKILTSWAFLRGVELVDTDYQISQTSQLIRKHLDGGYALKIYLFSYLVDKMMSK
jgi:hypothetical protein